MHKEDHQNQDAVQKDAVQKDAAQKDTAQKDAVQKDTTQKENQTAPATSSPKPMQKSPNKPVRREPVRRKPVPFFKQNKFKRGTLSTLTIIVVIILIVLCNIFAQLLAARYPSINVDISPEGRNSLSEDAITAAKAVSQETELLILFDEATARETSLGTSADYTQLNYSQVVNLAAQMCEVNENITVSYEALDQNPSLQREYEADNISAGGIIVRTAEHYRYLSMVGDLFTYVTDAEYNFTYYSAVETALIIALQAVSSENDAKAAFTSGHNEILSPQYRTGLESLLKSQLYTTEDFNILTSDIPQDTDLLVIPAPSTDFTDDEIQKLRDFLADSTSKSDHSLLYIAYPGADTPILDAFLEEWGISVDPGFVLETDSSRLFASDYSYMLVDSPGEVLGENRYDTLSSPMSVPISVLFDQNDDLSVYRLWQTSAKAVVAVDAETPADALERSIKTVAALSQKQLADDGSKYASIAVFGSYGAFMDAYASSNTFSNRQYFVDLFSLMTHMEAAPTYDSMLETGTLDVMMDEGTVRVMGFGVFTMLLPLLIVGIGLCVFVVRRYK